MKKRIIFIVVSIVIVTGVYYWQNKNDSFVSVDIASEATVGTYQSGAVIESVDDISKYGYTEKYSHPTKHFSFNYPKGFTVTSISNDEAETIIVQNTNTKIAVQITISPFQGNDIDLTREVIKNEIPDIKVDGAQEVEIGLSRKGLAFTSDNPAFGGKSSEIWFVFKKNLYQISTYVEFDEFSKGIFFTLEFE